MPLEMTQTAFKNMYNFKLNHIFSALENLLKKFSVKLTPFIPKPDPLNLGFNILTELDFLLLFNTHLTLTLLILQIKFIYYCLCIYFLN